jgi:rubrerythrin
VKRSSTLRGRNQLPLIGRRNVVTIGRDNEQLNQLLYEALETEMGGVLVYKTAIRCAVNDDLKQEWKEYLEQTQKHGQVVRELLNKFKLDPDTDTPGRKIVRHIGESLMKAMEMALKAGKPEAAQIHETRYDPAADSAPRT